MFRIVFTTLAFIGALFQIFVAKVEPLEAFLFNLIFFNIGFLGIFAFLSHYFVSSKGTVKVIMQPGNFFQNLIAFLNLFRGILGILCVWLKGNFWSLTIIISSIFLLSYAFYEIRHLEDIAASEDGQYYAEEFVLNFDLSFPIVLIILLVVYKMGI